VAKLGKLWKNYLKHPLLLADKVANLIIVLVKYRRFEWRTVSARWGEERGHNPIADVGCPILDVIDPTTDDHCGDAAKHESKDN